MSICREEVWAEHQDKLLRRLAGRLPHDVRVWRVGGGAAAASTRASRRSGGGTRTGSPTIPGGVDPLLRGHVLWHDWPLDVDAMNEAAAPLLGEHDFAAYCKRREGATTIRTLQELSWERGADGIITATVRADAFCHNMVRSLVGRAAVRRRRAPAGWTGRGRCWRPACGTRRCMSYGRTG